MTQKRDARKSKGRRKKASLSKRFLVHLGREASSIPGYAMREVSGQRHGSKPKCTMKKGWFE